MGNYWGSAPPPVAKPPEPPRSPSLRQLLGFSTPSTGKACRSLPAHPRFAQLLGFSTPSSGKATGASPLTLASLNYWGSAPPPVAKPPEPPRSPSLRSITGVQHPLQWQSHRSLPAHPRFAQLLGFSTPSSGKATGASPLTLASLGQVFSAAAFSQSSRQSIVIRLISAFSSALESRSLKRAVRLVMIVETAFILFIFSRRYFAMSLS